MSNHSSRMSDSLLNSLPPHFTQEVPGGNKFSAAFVPNVRCVFGEQLHDSVEDLAVRQRLAAAIAIEHDDRHAPDPLSGNARSGRTATMLEMRSSPHEGIHFT